MSFPLGVVAYPALVSTDSSASSKSPKVKTDLKGASVTSSDALGPSFFKKDLTPQKPKPTGTPPHSPAKSWSFKSRRKQSREGRRTSSGQRGLPHSPPTSSDSTACPSGPSSPHDSFELADQSHKALAVTRPKHIPIVIPSQYSYISNDNTDLGSGTTSTFGTNCGDPVCSRDLSNPSTKNSSSEVLSSRPRHVELNIPDWTTPVSGSARDVYLPSPNKFQSAGRPTDSNNPKYTHTSQANLDSKVTTMTDSNAPHPSERFRPSQSNNGSSANLHNTYASQASLGAHTEDDSASEAESVNPEEAAGLQNLSRGAGESTSQTPGGTTTNLSGLVCNVHRTTGKEPHPLVGATTTVLGDKLYVFGGRRVSRTKSQLTANIYELDLVKRHWTKLETKGDIPPPRYFHSVCALGDTKLVCYGGMSPSPSTEVSAEAQPEVIVMSDVHIYDVPTLTWTKVVTPDAPQGRYAHCAAILPSGAVFASPNAPMSAVHHNPSGVNPNQGSLGVSLDGAGGAEMVIVGGQDSANHYIEQVSVFNLRSLKWTGTTGMGRSCGAYRSVVTPLTTMKAAHIGAGPQARNEPEKDDDQPTTIGSGAPMLIYSNYNFLDVKLELQVRLTDGTLTEKTMQTSVSPPGLRFPNGGVIDNHFVVSGTFLTSSKQEYALWALDLSTLTWSRIDAGGSIFSQGSWNRGVLWSRRNSFVILGHRNRSLVDDYNNRRINFSNMCVVELEAFGLYENPKTAEPTSSFLSASGLPSMPSTESFSRLLCSAAEDLGAMALSFRELADMDFLAIDGTRVPVNSRLIARRWGPHFVTLLRESLASSSETDTATLRPSTSNHPSRNSSVTITPSVNSGATTLTNNTNNSSDLPDARNAHPSTRARLFYLPHTAPTLHALLHYLYTSTLPAAPHPLATPQILCSLLQIARPYNIDGLLEAVVERLHECLDGRNAAAIFNAAAMGAGGGDSIHFVSPTAKRIPSRDIPPRTASLAGIDSLLTNGGSRTSTLLRIDTDMANTGRTTRNTVRGPGGGGDDTDDEPPSSATTDTSAGDADFGLSPNSVTGRSDHGREVWTGSLSAVVGLQKRGLRGLMEGRRLRERGKSEGVEGAARVGLGIA